MRTTLLTALCAMLLMASCSTTKQNLSYFENLNTEKTGSLPSGDFEIRLIPDDELFISVSSIVPEATAMFNMPLANPAARSMMTTTTQPQSQTYVVDKSGNITFPMLGKVAVQGKTIVEITEMLKTKISEDVKDPFVRVELVNFRVNVLGEVKQPGSIDIKGQRFSVLDAIAQVGDLTEFGLRENVLLIREENGVKTYHRLNLNDSAFLSSPYFYLQQNDVIYVEPNKIRKDNSKYNQNNAFKLSVVATIVSALSVIASLVIALALKN